MFRKDLYIHTNYDNIMRCSGLYRRTEGHLVHATKNKHSSHKHHNNWTKIQFKTFYVLMPQIFFNPVHKSLVFFLHVASESSPVLRNTACFKCLAVEAETTDINGLSLISWDNWWKVWHKRTACRPTQWSV